MTKQQPDWPGLREAVADQLNATGATSGEIAQAAGLSRETVRPILNGAPGNYRPPTLAKVSLALGWTGDSIERVLRGEPPRPRGDDINARVAALEEEMRSVKDDLAELLRRLEGMR